MTHDTQTPPPQPALGTDPGKKRSEWRELVQHALEGADAQFSLWNLKLMQLALAAALAIPLMLAVAALGVYGFVLLDQAAHIALSADPYPFWLSPLVRGGLYFGIFVAVVAPLIKNAFGSKPAASVAHG